MFISYSVVDVWSQLRCLKLLRPGQSARHSLPDDRISPNKPESRERCVNLDTQSWTWSHYIQWKRARISGVMTTFVPTGRCEIRNPSVSGKSFLWSLAGPAVHLKHLAPATALADWLATWQGVLSKAMVAITGLPGRKFRIKNWG